MPRRKRGNQCDKKNRLMFIESPVNIPHPRPSPVNCAEHPPTAKVIPIDETLDIPWVSPQFRKYPTSCRKKRTSRFKGNELANSTLPRRELPKGFKVLKFCGDESTILENNCENCINEQVPNHGKLAEEDKPDVTELSGIKHLFETDHSGISPTIVGEQILSMQRVTRSRSRSGILVGLLDNDNASDSHSFQETQRLTRKVQNCPNKRLFAEIIDQEKSTTNDSLCTANELTMNSGAKNILRARRMPVCSSPCHIFCTDGRPLWATPPVTRQAIVLVEETPEAEQTLSYKERFWKRINSNISESNLTSIKE